MVGSLLKYLMIESKHATGLNCLGSGDWDFYENWPEPFFQVFGFLMAIMPRKGSGLVVVPPH